MVTKLSWGTRIAMLYVGFVVLMIVLIVGSMRQSFDLVSKDYYAEEIAYQNTIDASRNQSELSAAALVDVQPEKVLITLPAEFKGREVKAELHFYSPVSASLDDRFKYSTVNGEIAVARKELKDVSYKLKMNWECEGKKYYQETDANLFR
jgi:hypothetical protein